MIPAVWRRAKYPCTQWEIAKIWVDDDKVGKVFDDAFHYFVVVGFG